VYSKNFVDIFAAVRRFHLANMIEFTSYFNKPPATHTLARHTWTQLNYSFKNDVTQHNSFKGYNANTSLGECASVVRATTQVKGKGQFITTFNQIKIRIFNAAKITVVIIGLF